MITLPQRLRQYMLAVTITGAILIPGRAAARVGNPNAVPASSAYVISVPDVPVLWTAWKANAIYEAFKKTMASPEMAPKMQAFNEQLKTIESALGFPLNGESLSKIFKSFDAYMTAGENAGQVTYGFVSEVTDRAKLEKLIGLAEKAAISAAAQAADESSTGTDSGIEIEDSDKKSPTKRKSTTSTDDDNAAGGADGTEKLVRVGPDTATTKSADAAGPVSSETYKGVAIKRFSGGDDSELFYAIVDTRFVASNSRAELNALIDRLKGGNTAETFAASEQYKAIEAGLAARAGEAFIFSNMKQAMEVGGEAKLQFLENFMKRLAPVDFTGTSVKIDPKKVTAYGFAPLSTAEEAQAGRDWVRKNPGDKPMEIVNYTPAETLFVGATSLLDAKSVSDLFSGLMALSGGGSDIEKQLSQAEGTLGFSLKDDLVPAMGNELAFLLNSVKFGGGPLPSVDAAIIFRIQDKDRLNKVLAGIEKLVGAMGAQAGGGAAANNALKTDKAGTATIKYMEVAMAPGYSPGYAIDGEYLIIATSKESIKGMVDAKGGKANGFTKSELYTRLQPNVSSTANGFSLVNFKGIWSTLKLVIQAFPMAQGISPFIEAASVLNVYGTSTTLKENAVITEAVLLLD